MFHGIILLDILGIKKYIMLYTFAKVTIHDNPQNTITNQVSLRICKQCCQLVCTYNAGNLFATLYILV